MIRKFPVNSLNNIIARSNLTMDNEITQDALGSIRIQSADTTTAYLFLVDSIPFRSAKLKWEAYCRTEELKGSAFLEMGVLIGKEPEVETYLHYSDDNLTKSTDWKKLEVTFLVKDKKVSNCQLNFVVEGVGTAWIDRVIFSATPLK